MCVEMGSHSPEPLGDAEWGRWPFCNLPDPSRGPSNPRPRPRSGGPGWGPREGNWLRLAARLCWEGGGAHGPHVARDSREASSWQRAGASGGQENLAFHVASHPRREWRVTSPLAGEERSEGAGGSDVGPQRRGHGGSGGGSCCLSSGCRPSELGTGARAQRAALRQWQRGRREPGEGSRRRWGGGGEAPEGRGLREGGPLTRSLPFPLPPLPSPLLRVGALAGVCARSP